jgi:hypothetical protein
VAALNERSFKALRDSVYNATEFRLSIELLGNSGESAMSTEMLNELMRRAEALTEEEKMRLATHLVDRTGKSLPNGSDPIRASVDANAVDPERRLEQQWLSQHGAEYAGQWVALDGDCLLSYGTDGRVVLSEARRAGVVVPFVVRVDAPDELPFGGW